VKELKPEMFTKMASYLTGNTEAEDIFQKLPRNVLIMTSSWMPFPWWCFTLWELCSAEKPLLDTAVANMQQIVFGR
jgi:hypothetical protein